MVVAVEHELEALHQPAAADVADDRVAVGQLAQAGVQQLALRRHARADAVGSSTSSTVMPTAATSGSETCVV